MASPAQLAKRAAKQTKEILDVVQALVVEVDRLASEVSELKDALVVQPAPRRKPAAKK